MKDNYINRIFNMTTLNFKEFIKFEFLYKLMISIIFIPVAFSSFKLLLNLLGLTIINQETIYKIITSPIMITYFLLLFIVIILFLLFEIVSLIVLFDNSYHNKKSTIKEIIKISVNKCRSIFKIKNIPVFLYLLLITPFLNISVIASMIAITNIPRNIVAFATNNFSLIIIIVGLYLLLVAFFSDWLYTIYYMVIEDASFKTSKNKSKKLSKNNTLKDHIKILISQAFYTATTIGIIVLCLLLYTVIEELFKDSIQMTSQIFIIILIISVSIFVIVSSISNGISYSVISALYYKNKKDKKENIKNLKYNEKVSMLVLKKLVKCSLGILLIYMGVLSFFEQNTLKIEKKEIKEPKVVEEIEITAHRGASIDYPENTMAAFKGAKKLGAKWIELDIHQTKDKELIVMHDANTGRTTGYHEAIENLTLDEIKKLDCGWLFSKEFAGEKVPTLEEVIVYAKDNDLKINIELKNAGYEVDFEQQTVDLVKKYDYAKNVIFQTWSYESLAKVKEIDNNLKTAYLYASPLNELDVDSLEAVDILSVESQFIDGESVQMIHEKGKEIYAWTVDSEDRIKDMIDINVDNIITNDIILAKILAAEREMNTVMVNP